MDSQGLQDILKREYVLNNRASATGNLYHFKHVVRVLNGTPVEHIGPARIEDYKAQRLKEGAKPQTVNNELSLLRRSFNLALEQEILLKVPKIRLLAVDNARQGFIKPDEFAALIRTLEVLDQVVADIVTWLYLLGWRCKEVSNLKWKEVDLRTGTVQLPAARSKTRQLRTIRVGGELLAVLQRRWGIRNGDCVFHREGSPVKCFRGTWERAVKALGRPELVPHDCRRSFARNALLAGVPVKTIMDIGGWRTMSVFLRYAIMDEEAISEALDVVSGYVRGKRGMAP